MSRRVHPPQTDGGPNACEASLHLRHAPLRHDAAGWHPPAEPRLPRVDERAGRADDSGAARHLRAAERGGDVRRRGDAAAPAARRRRRLPCAARRQGGGLRHQPRLARPAAGDPGALPRVQGHRLRARRGVDHRQLRAAVPEEPVRDLAHAEPQAARHRRQPRRGAGEPRPAGGLRMVGGQGGLFRAERRGRCSSSNTTGWSRTPVRASPGSTISSGSRDSSTTSTTSSTTSPSSTASSRRRACTRSRARSPGARGRPSCRPISSPGCTR